MQLDVEVSPPAFIRAQVKLECTCSVSVVYMQCWLNAGCIGFAVHVIYPPPHRSGVWIQCSFRVPAVQH